MVANARQHLFLSRIKTWARSFHRSISFLFLTGYALGAVYNQADSHSGSTFLNGFSVQAIGDPTNGRVNYVNAQTAATQNLTFGNGDTFILRADSTSVLNPSGPGRNSVRLQSLKQYETSVVIFNLRHLPQGCGTWPAVWSFGEPWPYQGEIDILEGVNDQGVNHATLHTDAGCTMDPGRPQTGTPQLDNCDVAANGNTGCGVAFSANSYGPSFNANGGGWYAMERTDTAIRVWFWPRNAQDVPEGVRNGNSQINTDTWGVPAAYFPDTFCDIASKFGPHNIIINLTFCGDWAGQQGLYAAAGCPGTCIDFVNNNPQAFTNAYFDFAWMKVYI